MIYGNAWIVTMDGAGTEHERGWLEVEDGLITQVGAARFAPQFASGVPVPLQRGATTAIEMGEDTILGVERVSRQGTTVDRQGTFCTSGS